MPYSKKTDLPENVTEHLPDHAQDIYRKAYNAAWDQYDKPEERKGGRSREETAHAVAWSAVKKEYTKRDDGKWVRQEE